ncbi:hypothetical protein GGP41_004938, partial [Bipolaris sorokiniana]
STLSPFMTLSVALRARWRRALASLTRLALASLHDHPFCLCSKLLSLLHLEDSTRSYILTLLTLLLSLTLLSAFRELAYRDACWALWLPLQSLLEIA